MDSENEIRVFQAEKIDLEEKQKEFEKLNSTSSSEPKKRTIRYFVSGEEQINWFDWFNNRIPFVIPDEEN